MCFTQRGFIKNLLYTTDCAGQCIFKNDSVSDLDEVQNLVDNKDPLTTY